MPEDDILHTVKGTLVAGNRELPVDATYASRYSVWVDASSSDGAVECSDAAGAGQTEPGKVAMDQFGEYSRLILTIADRKVEMGPCRVVESDDKNPKRFRLVPYGRIHDFEKLFFRSKLETLESSAVNLPLILSYKERIDPAFKEYVSDLTYDLNAYKNALDRMDEEFAHEPEAVRAIVQHGILKSVGPELTRYLDERLADLIRITSGYSGNEHEHHGFYFRKQLWNIILCCPIMARTNLKPRGYSGDSEMMRMIYVGGYRGSGSFGKILHKHAMDQPAADAVRNRRRDIAAMLREYVSEKRKSAELRGKNRKLKILSVACGPAFEIQDIVATKEDAENLHFSLLDQDEQALLEASQLVRTVEQTVGTELSVDFIKESVRTMLVTTELRERWGRFNFIYSMGLFDYLTAPVATAVLRKLYQLLMPGGEMIIGNFHSENPTRFYMAYWLDWTILYRSEREFLSLASRLPGADADILFDATRIQMLLRVRKRESEK